MRPERARCAPGCRGLARGRRPPGAVCARDPRCPIRWRSVSIDNLEVCEYTAPPLSSYAIEPSELAETTLMLLSDSIVGRFKHKHHILLSTRLVARQSFVPAEDVPES